MKVVKGIVKGVLFVVAILAALLAVGTIWNIPVVHSFASYGTIRYAHIFLPVCVGLLLISALMLGGKKKALPILMTILFGAAICLDVVAAGRAVKALRDEGVRPDLLAAYKKHDFGDVRKETKNYESSDKETLLDVYYVDDDKTDKPVLVYVHGGGWISGTREYHAYTLRTLARNGYVAVSADYDLSDKEHHYADSVETQLTRAFAWVKEHIAEYGGKGTEVYVLGDSAGGNLALDVAYKINGGVYVKAGDVVLPKIKGVCALYPVADPAAYYANDELLYKKYAQTSSTYYVGATPEENPAAYAAITPKNYLSADAPATLFIVGEGDTVADPQWSYDLSDLLQKNGTRTRVVSVPYANHAFDYSDGNFGSEAVNALMLAFFGEE